MSAPHGDLSELSAVAATAAMRDGDVAAETYANALLARCEAGAALNAFITLEPERVREAAQAADKARSAGGPLGALHGLPIPIKDSVNTKDLRTTAGADALRDFHPKTDATAVAKLRAAGGVVLGKTNLHELSFGWTSSNAVYGPVRNPYDPSRIPGGSSGGTAAAVAARMAPLGVAEDTQGSIRVPAALCGVCGFRPTTGRYPSDGTAPITPLFDQIGPHARCVADLALFDAVMTGDARPLSPVRLEGLRLGVDRAYFFAGCDPEIAEAIEAALAQLTAAGVVLVDAPVPDLAKLIQLTTATIQLHDAFAAIERYLAASGAPIDAARLIASTSPDIRALLQRFSAPGGASAISEETYAAARDWHRPALQFSLAQTFATHNVAALLLPATMIPATPIGQATTVRIAGVETPFSTAISRNISPGSTAGLPGLVLPAGLTRTMRLPVGLELDGPAGADRDILALGLAIEAALPAMPAPKLA